VSDYQITPTMIIQFFFVVVAVVPLLFSLKNKTKQKNNNKRGKKFLSMKINVKILSCDNHQTRWGHDGGVTAPGSWF